MEYVCGKYMKSGDDFWIKFLLHFMNIIEREKVYGSESQNFDPPSFPYFFVYEMKKKKCY